MAKKDFDDYVLKLSKQCDEFKKVLESISAEAQNNLVDLDYIDHVEQQKVRIEENYQRVLFIKFLLDQPAKKKKVNKYNKTLNKIKKTLSVKNSTEAVLQENESIIKDIESEKC